MENIVVAIESPAPRPVFEDEVNLLLEILPPDLIHAIAMLGHDEADSAGLSEQQG